MKKEELITRLSNNTGFTKKDMTEFLKGLEKTIYDAVAEGEDIPLIRGMRIYRAVQAPRQCRNPHTGELFMSAEKYVPRVKISPYFKEAISK